MNRMVTISQKYTKKWRETKPIKTLKKTKGKRSKEERNSEPKQPKNKIPISTHLSIIMLNVNGLNASIKRQGGRMDK